MMLALKTIVCFWVSNLRCVRIFPLLMHDCKNTWTVAKTGDKQIIGPNNHHCKCVFHLKYVCETGGREREVKRRDRGGERKRENENMK